MNLWTTQSLGGKLIIGSGVLAVLSLFLPWADLGFVSASGFQQDGYLFILPLIYPVYKAVKLAPLNRIAGLVLSGLTFVAAIAFAVSKQVEMMGASVNGAGSGLYLFIITAAVMGAGVYLYKPGNTGDEASDIRYTDEETNTK
ncbi:hypothetical protein [Salisediminibacterium selenitireducens]|uniref:Uncharacterized protein n=1 Tax=Bacillus selenitireducens (strain ATCC 700615 / DSM 15326 / MLS10) TaxID=439292 RepID=D6XYB4_BACIE|nr:hypothetical protein [Salisediminibacterium selenitireducens]ADI00183.1 hypothetical protein Bsel_2685 [[Bacillus] selenitireducens MLS10]